MATQPDLSLPSNWGSYAPEQKIDYFNTNNVSAAQLGAAGVSAADIGWMQGHGYTGGSTPATPTAGTGSVGSAVPPAYSAPASSGIAGLSNAYAPPTYDAQNSLTLPYGWTGYDPAQKIDYFNANNVSADQLRGFGTSDADLAWMRGQGYRGEKAYGTGDKTVTPSQLREYAAKLLSTPAASGAIPQAFSMLDYAKNYGVGADELQNILTPEAYKTFSDQIGTRLTSGLGDIASDKKISFDEAVNALNSLKYYGLTDEQSAKFLGKQAPAVGLMRGIMDSGFNKVIGGMTSDKNITSDEAKNLLSAAKKYGLSDADIAKYTGGAYTEQQISDYFNPVRGFEESAKQALSNPNLTADQLKEQLSSYTNDPLVSGIYAAPLAKIQEDFSNLSKKWVGDSDWQLKGNAASQNPFVAEKLYSQLNGLHNTVASNLGKEYWSGEGHGSIYKNMQAFTTSLLNNGVTDLKQLTMGDVPAVETGKFVAQNGGWALETRGQKASGEPGDMEIQYKPVTDPKVLNQLQNSDSPVVYLDYDTGKTQKHLINKDTGEAVGKAVGDGNTFRVGSTAAGKGMVYYNVAMQPRTDPATGQTSYIPVPVQQYKDTSSVRDIAPVLAMASFVPGVAPFAMAANAALAASQGNWTGALLSGIGAVPGLSAAAGMPLAAETAKTIAGVSSGLRVANALSKGDYLGAITGAGNLVGAGGWTVPGTAGVFGENGLNLGQLGKGLGALGALANGQYLPGMLAGADLAGVKDIAGTGIAPKDVASSLNVLQALQGGDPTKIVNTLGRTGQAYGVIPKAAGGLASLVG